MFDFLKISSASVGLAPQTFLVNSECIYFRTNMLIQIFSERELRQFSFLVDFFLKIVDI